MTARARAATAAHVATPAHSHRLRWGMVGGGGGEQIGARHEGRPANPASLLALMVADGVEGSCFIQAALRQSGGADVRTILARR